MTVTRFKIRHKSFDDKTMHASVYLQILLILLFLRNGVRVSGYLRKTLYKTSYKLKFGVVISEVIKITFNSKLKPLFVLFACMCIFACASCVNAADVDDALANSQIDFGEADISMYAVADDTSYTDSSADSYAIYVPDSGVINYHSHSGKKTHFSHKDKKFGNDSSAKHHGHRHHKNVTYGDNMHHHKRSHDMDTPVPHQEADEHAYYGDVQNEKIIKTDISGHIFNNATKSARTTSPVSKMTEQSEFSCCEDNCSSHSSGIDSINAIICRNINDDSAYSYEDYYVLFNTTASAEGIVSSKNQNSRNREENHILNINSDMDWDDTLIGDCSDPFYYSHAQEGHDGTNIDSKFSELNVNDYNMEYYIFTNPDIIVKKANSNENFTLTNSNTLNRCPTLDAKTTYFDSPILSGCITDNYVLFNNTFYKKSNFMLLKSNVLSSVQSPVNLADGSAITLFMLLKSNVLSSVQSPVNLADGSAITLLSIFGGSIYA